MNESEISGLGLRRIRLIQEIIFEPGEVLLNTEFSKGESAAVIRSHGHLESESIIQQRLGSIGIGKTGLIVRTAWWWLRIDVSPSSQE